MVMANETTNDKLTADLASLRITRGPVEVRQKPIPKYWLGGLAALLLAGGFGRQFLSRGSIDPRQAVEVTEVRRPGPVAATVAFSAVGHVIPEQTARVGSDLTNRIASVHIKEGGIVHTKDLLFVLEDADLRSGLAIAEAQASAARARLTVMQAQLEELRIPYERMQGLAEVGATNRAAAEDLARKLSSETVRVRAAAAEVAVKDAEVSAARTALAHTRIFAPIDGVAVTRPLSIGDVVSPAISLVELVDLASLQVEADLPESRLESVRLHMPVEVICDAMPNRRLHGEVSAILPRLNRAKATGAVRIKVAEMLDRLRPEMAARINFLSSPEPASPATAPSVSIGPHPGPPWRLLEAPQLDTKVVTDRAITHRDGRPVLFTVEGGLARLVTIEVGASIGGDAELRSGPAVGTRVVLNPPANLTDFTQVIERQP